MQAVLIISNRNGVHSTDMDFVKDASQEDIVEALVLKTFELLSGFIPDRGDPEILILHVMDYGTFVHWFNNGQTMVVSNKEKEDNFMGIVNDYMAEFVKISKKIMAALMGGDENRAYYN